MSQFAFDALAFDALAFDALVLDLDGTLVADDGQVRPRVADALRARIASGLAVMVATGRSESGCIDIAAELGLDLPLFVYNGAGLWCSKTNELLEERVLSNTAVERSLAFGKREGLLTVSMQRGRKFVSRPRNATEERGLVGLENLTVMDFDELPREHLIRIGFYAEGKGSAVELGRRVEEELQVPIYLTEFPLCVLAQHRDSPLEVVDVQPPCRGKAEALRWLHEERGIVPERVVAVGDGSNDVPMLRRAGLGVALEGSMEEALQAADRVIGPCNGDSLADLIEELFPL